MINKRTKKIKDGIILSVKYAFLVEQRKTVRDSLAAVDNKKIKTINEKITQLNKAINNIEQNNKPKQYFLSFNNKLEKQVEKLKKHKNFGLDRYIIAIEILLDGDYNITENAAFMENISTVLFGSKDAIKNIANDYKKTADKIYGTFMSGLENMVKPIFEMDIKAVLSRISFVPAKKMALGVAAAAGVASFAGLQFFKQKKQIKKMGTLAPGILANKLIISAMMLSYAKLYFEKRADYRNYFKSRLIQINLERRFIMKQALEEQFDLEDNEMKIKMLQNFDNYLLQQIKQEKK